MGLYGQRLQRVGLLAAASIASPLISELRPTSGAACAQLQATVSLAVTLEMVFSGEGLVAEWTLKGPCPTVEGQVVFEVV